MKVRKRTWLLVTWAVFVAFSFRGMPLIYDETWNYNETAALGPVYTLTHYSFNNHVLYAFFMSLIPHRLVILEPFLMRVPNWLTSMSLFTLIYLFSETAFGSSKTNGRMGILQFVLATSAIFGSTQLTYYYLVGRGYLLGCTLTFAAIYYRQRRFSDWISDVALTLSAYALFTYVYTWPGLLAVDLVEEGVSPQALRRVFHRWTRSTLLLLLLYAPLLTAMNAESRDYHQFSPTWGYTLGLLQTTFAWPSLSPFLILGAIGLAISTYLVTRVGVRTRVNADQSALLAAYLSIALLSFFAVSEATNRLHMVQPPYVRNAMFISLYGIVAAGLSAGVWLRTSRLNNVGVFRLAAALAVLVTLSINGLATASVIVPPLLTGQYLHFPVSNPGCAVPINNRFLKSLPKGTEIFCGGYAANVCWSFRSNIERFGLTYLPGGDDAFDREPRIKECWSGTEAGDRSCSLYVRPTKSDPFQPLCY